MSVCYAEIYVTIRKDMQGHGIGSQAIKELCEIYMNNFSGDDEIFVIIAQIKPHNIHSLKAFTKADFVIDKEKKAFVEMRLYK
jgi:RimJ/RimL family protein N-acetyltransferase